MNKEYIQQDQKYLPSHLLDDDDAPTTTSIKNGKKCEKEFAFSAPPILFNLGYRIQQDFFDNNQKSWQIPQFNSSSKMQKKQRTVQVTQYELQLNNTRKLSLQNQEQYHTYQSYQNINTPAINYFPMYSAQQQILNNLQYVSQWCKDQYGSRNIQSALETSNQYLKNKIFQYLSYNLNELIYDKFGNYVVQKFIDYGNQEQIQAIYQVTKKQFLFICLHSYGCRVIQKIVEFAANRDYMQYQIMKILETNMLQIILNQNGNHIAQKILEIFDKQPAQNISNLILFNIQRLSFHAFGCRVVQKYLQNGKNEQIYSKIMSFLIKLAFRLSKCQYGNYIMQYIVTNNKTFSQEILNMLAENFGQLSCNKFASNVIQKVIKFSPKAFSQDIIDKIISNQEFIAIAKNQFGNYVIQSLLQKSCHEKRLHLKAKLKQFCQQISKSQYGRHVLLQLQKFK